MNEFTRKNCLSSHSAASYADKKGEDPGDERGNKGMKGEISVIGIHIKKPVPRHQGYFVQE